MSRTWRPSWPGWSTSRCHCSGRPWISPLVAATYQPWDALGGGAGAGRPATGFGGPADGPGRRGGGPGPQPHLVRQHGRPPGQADVRHPPRGHHAQPGAFAALEARPAGPRLRGLVVLRADRADRRRRRDRRLQGHARRRPGRSTRRSIRTGWWSSTTASTPTTTGPTTAPTSWCATGSTRTSRR